MNRQIYELITVALILLIFVWVLVLGMVNTYVQDQKIKAMHDHLAAYDTFHAKLYPVEHNMIMRELMKGRGE